jgi:hypothetical protein
MLAGNLVAGWQMARSLLVAEDLAAKGEDTAFMRAKIATARFYADHLLAKAPGMRDSHRRRRRQRHGAGARSVLIEQEPMSKLPAALQNLPLPVIGSPLFIISNPKLVIEQCKAGIVGAMPALNARPASQLDEWLHEITETLAARQPRQSRQAGGAVRHQPDRAQEQ